MKTWQVHAFVCCHLQIQKEEKPSQKTKKVERDVKKVRRMYNLAQSNEASTQRSVFCVFNKQCFVLLISVCTGVVPC